ncbi:MAG TPA: protein kinase [Thermoanaerobaculia bacterium]|nr:protein kinase [Thermoanaerobaculia bacterium]
MTLAAGARLGPYEILSPLGAGGMGEVYRAKDSRLGREVAVKVLPSEVAGDPERLRRFEQEARAASALNHPSILTVHDFGTHDGVAYLVTELLQGESVRELLRKGPLAPRRALELATQLAKGLAAAHDEGIVHRDLKPENLFLARNGTAKILDFGLARIERPELAAANLSKVSTMLETSAGTVLGTVGYMAPEQVRGERADARSDLFSLGVALHEMLTGANPFHRGSVVESLNAILREEPAELAPTPSGANPGLGRVVTRLLEKDPARRFRSAHDLVFALEGLAETPSGPRPASALLPPPLRKRSPWQIAAAFALLAAGLALGGLFVRFSPREAPRPVRFEIAPSGAGGFPSNAETHNLALSPDGRTLAYVTREGGRSLIHLRALDRVEPEPIAGSEGANSPFWSPDGSTLAFFAGGKLKRVARGGGPVQSICEVQGSNTGAWGSNGVIVFSQGFGPNDGLFRVAAGGGSPERLSKPGDVPRWIEFLPDGRSFLYWSRRPGELTGQTVLADLVSGETKPLVGVVSQARYAAPGWLVYLRGSTLVAHRFDADSATLEGEALPIASGVPFFFNGWGAFSVAGPHALAYQIRPAPTALAWYDRHGREIGPIGPAAFHLAVRLSPDGTQAAVTRSDPDTEFTDVWIVDLGRGGATRLTDEPYLDWSPAWSPDGELLAYTTVAPGPRFTVTVRRAVDGTKVTALPPHASFFWVRGWSRAGAFLDANEPATGWDLWRWPALDVEPQPLLATEFGERLASPSPDGRWLAFYTSESGGGEIELIRPSAPGRRIRVSRGARGVVPRWRGDGGELFYVSTDGWLTAIPVGAGDPPTLGEPTPLFRVDLVGEDSFDVTADGQRFLVAGTPPTSSLPITVALDWQAALPRD